MAFTYVPSFIRYSLLLSISRDTANSLNLLTNSPYPFRLPHFAPRSPTVLPSYALHTFKKFLVQLFFFS